MGKGAIDEDHALYPGITGIQTSQQYGNASFLESDLVLAVGARFGDRHTGANLDVYRGERSSSTSTSSRPRSARSSGRTSASSPTRAFLQALLARA